MLATKSTYIWTSNGKPSIKNVNGYYYESEVVNMVGFMWQFEFYPNFDLKGYATMKCDLVCLPPKISQRTHHN